jgi:hypothetical protein
MSDDRRFVTDSLEALLVSIAEGARDAQEAMSETPPLDAFGRPLPTYHLPYLDFEVKVDAETTETPGGFRFLRIKAFGGSGADTSREISSTISGRLVAVPPGEGMPRPVLTIAAEPLSSRRHRLVVQAGNTAGEILSGQVVELNLDMDASRRLSELAGVNLAGPRAGTVLEEALLVTDESGTARGRIDIDDSLDVGVVLVVSARLGSAVASVSVSPGDDA